MNESGARGSAFLAAGASVAVANGGPPSRDSSPLVSSSASAAAGGSGCASFDPYADQEELLFTEQYPSKLCALCNLSERSALGQGEMVKYKVSADFNLAAEVKRVRQATGNGASDSGDGAENNGDGGGPSDRSPKNSGGNGSANNSSALNARRKGRKLTSGDLSEPVDELENVGFSEEPDHSLLFESSGEKQ